MSLEARQLRRVYVIRKKSKKIGMFYVQKHYATRFKVQAVLNISTSNIKVLIGGKVHNDTEPETIIYDF